MRTLTRCGRRSPLTTSSCAPPSPRTKAGSSSTPATGLIPGPLALIAALLDRFGRHEPAAIIMGVGDQPGPRTTFPEIDSAIAHLREALGDATYESLARTGAAMTTAAAVTCALEQIGYARAELLETEST